MREFTDPYLPLPHFPVFVLTTGKCGSRSYGSISLDVFCFRVLFQRLLNRLRHLFAFGLFPGFKASDDLSIAVDQELVEVPTDVAAEFGIGFLAGEEFVE